MSKYDQYSKEELIRRIEELEQQQNSPQSFSPSEFKASHSVEILDILPDMLSVFDHNYNFVALASSEATVHVGGSGEKLCGKNLIEILPQDAYQPVKENFDKVLNTGKPSIGYHNLYVDGKLENFENRVIPLGDNKHILCVCRNITDRVKAQRQLEMVTSAVNNSLEEIYAVKTNGTLIFANKQFTHHFQLNTPIENYKIFDVIPGKTVPEWLDFVNKIKKRKNIDSHSFLQFRQNNQQHFRETSAFILKNNTEEEIVWIISRDITARIKQEKKIQELNQLMETILNNLPVYLYVKDTGNDFRYLYWNKEFARVSQIPPEKVIGKTDAEIFPEATDFKKFRQADLDLIQNQQPLNFEEEYTTMSGEKRNIHTIKTLVPLEDKAPLLIGISWDITNQKTTERELIKAREKAEESDKLKSAFLANMSHEIRTPLNAIVGFSKLMAETDEKTEREQYAEIVEKNTELLLQLINDILDLSKIEAGMLEFVRKPVPLNELCQSIYETFQPRISPGIRFVYEKNTEDVILQTDGNRIAQILSNLLTNANKFTKEGEIRFGFQHQGKEIEFYVQDTGMGIAPEHVNRIFNRFIKLNNFIQGTGLGLPICKMIIENLGGQIGVDSTLNKGSKFHFTLPWNPPAEEKSIPSSPSIPSKNTKSRLTILIAEDVESNFLLLKTLLGKKYNLLHASNGREAIELFSENSPDLILMDLKMPHMDGLEATRLIRTQSKDIPVIALSAFAYPSDQEEAFAAGCNDFLVKPVSVPLLQKTLEKYISL